MVINQDLPHLSRPFWHHAAAISQGIPRHHYVQPSERASSHSTNQGNHKGQVKLRSTSLIHEQKGILRLWGIQLNINTLSNQKHVPLQMLHRYLLHCE